MKIIARLLVFFAAAVPFVHAEEPPAPPAPVEEAAPVELAPHEAKIEFSEELSLASGSIAEQANVELLDIAQLRAIYERTGDENVLRVSLADCLALALRQNPDILIAEIEPLASGADAYAAKGEFDPIWQTDMQYLNAQQSLNQQAVAFGGIDSIRQYQTTINSTVGGKLHTGTQYAAVFALNKEENTFGGFIEEFNTNLTFQITQPLLRGMGRKYNTFRIRAARNLQASNEWQLRATVMNTVAQVIRAYWDVVGAVEGVKVSENALENARRLLSINETRREIGTAADIEVLQAKAGVSSRQGEVVTAVARAIDAGDLLKQVLNIRDGDYLSKLRILPLDRPAKGDEELTTPEAYDSQIDAAVQVALAERPEIRIAELAIENAELDADRTRKDLLPQLDVSGSITQGGRDHKLSESLYGIRERRDTAFTYGITAAVPLGNRAARGQYQGAKLRAEQAEQQLEKVRTGIMTNVQLAIRGVETSRILVKNSQQAVTLQAANVLAEEERLRLGVTTSWQVLQIQEALTAAQIQELQARIAFEKAQVELQLAKGTLLADMGIDYALPQAEKPIGYFGALKTGIKE